MLISLAQQNIESGVPPGAVEGSIRSVLIHVVRLGIAKHVVVVIVAALQLKGGRSEG